MKQMELFLLKQVFRSPHLVKIYELKSHLIRIIQVVYLTLKVNAKFQLR